MKLGVFTVVLGDLSLDEACGFLAENGVQMVEIGCGGFPEKHIAMQQNFWQMMKNVKSLQIPSRVMVWKSAH